MFILIHVDKFVFGFQLISGRDKNFTWCAHTTYILRNLGYIKRAIQNLWHWKCTKLIYCTIMHKNNMYNLEVCAHTVQCTAAKRIGPTQQTYDIIMKSTEVLNSRHKLHGVYILQVERSLL